MKLVYSILLLAMCGTKVALGAESLILDDKFDGSTLGKASGVTWAPGKDGQAAVLDTPTDSIEFPAESFGPRAGRIEFDLLFPQAIPKTHKTWCLFSDVGAGSAFSGAVIAYFQKDSSALEYGIFNNGFQMLYSKTTDWKPGQWYHLVLGYGPDGMRLEVNGAREASNSYTGGLANRPKTFGFHDAYMDSPPVMLDNLRVYRIHTDALDLYPPLVSPNGDGLFDTCKIAYELAGDSTVTLSLAAEDGTVVKTLVAGKQESAGEHTLTWDGAGVEDDRYQIVLTAKRAGETAQKQSNISVDTRWKWSKVDPLFNDTFPRGIYYFCEDDASYINRHIDDPAKARQYYETTMADLAAHGFDLVLPGWTPRDHRQMMLDAAHQKGLRVIVALDDLVNLLNSGEAFDRANLFDVAWSAIQAIKDHPAVVGYYIIDEPNATPALVRNIALVKKTLEAMDPKHPSFSCIRWDYESILTSVDFQVLLTDNTYAIMTNFNGDFATPYWPASEMSFITDLARAQRNAGTRPLWVIPQVFGRGAGGWRIPTPEEIRAQVWLSLAYGAKGIVYFIYQSTTAIQGESLQGLVDMNLKPMDGRLEEVGRLNAELKKLTPTLLKLQPATFTVPASAPLLIARPFTDDKGVRYAILANKSAKTAVQFSWGSELGVDVLTGAEVGKTITLQPGAGMVVRMEKKTRASQAWLALPVRASAM